MIICINNLKKSLTSIILLSVNNLLKVFQKNEKYIVESNRGKKYILRVSDIGLIDGYFYDMASPTTLHQLIAGEIYRQISNFIMNNNGECLPLISPIDVQLDCDEKTMVQPDVVILCDKDKLCKWGIFGAPEFVLEVISPSTKKKDYIKKLSKYEMAGVKEYWILDPYQQKLIVYFFESETSPTIYGLNEPVSLGIYKGELEIDFTHIAKWVEAEEE